MVNTIKMSQFAAANLNDSSNVLAGVGSGINIKRSAVVSWATAGRPVTPFSGLLGYNTDLKEYEYYDSTIPGWVQFVNDTDLASHASGKGASLIGLQNQSNVTNKTVQDLANAQFVVNVNNGSLQNAQSLGALTTGIVKNTTTTGVLSISVPLTQIDALSPVQGDILYYNGTAWVVLAPSTSGFVLETRGAGANPQWSPVGVGTVTEVDTGTGLTGGPITSTGTISLANIASHTLLSNITSGSAAPLPNTLSDTIDAAIGNTQGDILYRNATGWVVLPPGTSGQFLETQGAAANPIWANGNSGSVTSFSAGTLSPLFTTSVANPTTTPALSFILTNAGANTYFGNATSGSAAPSYTAAGALTRTNDTNVTLTLGGSPTVALLAATSLTLGWTGTLAIARGGTGVSSVTTTPNATAWAGWDANSNISSNNSLEGYATTVTAAATTTLTVASAWQQFFTGSTTQTVLLPVTSTLVLGHSFYIVNNSSGTVTVQSSGGNTIQGMAANTRMLVTCILTSGTTAASWSFEYNTQTAGSGTVTSITAGTGLAGGTITTTGTISAQNQCVFSAHLSANQNNVTGDGTLYFIPFDVADVNVGSNYNTGTFTFTVPSTGNYQFFLYAGFNASNSNNQVAFGIQKNGSGFIYFYDNNVFPSSSNYAISTSRILHLTAGDTLQVGIAVYGGAKNLNVYGSSSGIGESRFEGYIIN